MRAPSRATRPAPSSIATIALLLLLPLAAPPAAAAATCGSSSHRVVLDRGTVTPATGPPGTTFKFSVRYRSNAGCTPRSITVRIPGVGNYELKGPRSGYGSGATFSTSRPLAAGTWSYSYRARSGTGAGDKRASFTAVVPSPVVVQAASSVPGPTGAPVGPTGTPPAGPVIPSPGPGASPGVQPEPDTEMFVRFLLPLPLRSPAAWPMMVWMVGMAGGVGLFALVLHKSRRDRQMTPLQAELAGNELLNYGDARGLKEPPTERSPVTDGESHMPRWRRPSLQIARQTGYRDGPGAPAGRPALRFSGPAAAGVERRAIAYRLVRVSDAPDEIRSNEIGRLDRGDQVDILGMDGGFIRIRAADGSTGWIPQSAARREDDLPDE